MTPWLRHTLRLVRLLLVLVASAPAYGSATAYGAEAAPPGSPASSARTSASPSSSSALPRSSSSASASSGAADVSASASAGVPVRGAADVSASASPPEPSRAGSRPGEGRMRPGRPDGPAAEEEGSDTATASETADPEDNYADEPETVDSRAATPAASDTPREAGLAPVRTSPPAAGTAVHQGEAPAEPTPHILPLGSGLVLIGLGLALAFVGLRVRRS
ncbi:hypothetical protein ACWD5V_02880 [Streptomyces sp. NPDC002523]